MMKLLLNPEYGLYEKGGRSFCDSLQVAETFEKRHDNVTRDIREVIDGAGPKFSFLNFEESDYRDRGKRYPKHLMTKDGFTLLTMGYTGKKAMEFKIAYINRFNQMEAFIQSLQAAKFEFPAFTEAIMLSHEEPKHYHFSNEINMINRIVLGVDAKAFRESMGIKAGESIRPYLCHKQIRAIEDLQRCDIGLIEAGLDFTQRKEALKRRYGLRQAHLFGSHIVNYHRFTE
jgi:Rha family phage regulatory protein